MAANLIFKSKRLPQREVPETSFKRHSMSHPTAKSIPVTRMRNPQNKKTGILIIPGGSYQRVVYDKEGVHYVKAYNDAGYTCFVLVYRTPNDPHKDNSTVSLADAQRAMRVIRSRAQEFGINPDKLGVMGSSAGGHVAGSLAERFNDEVYKMQDKADKLADGSWTNAKPAFQMLM